MGIVEDMQECGWLSEKISIQNIEYEINNIINRLIKIGLIDIADKMSIRAIEREIWKLIIIRNAECWYSRDTKIIHTYADCPQGNNIEPENIEIYFSNTYYNDDDVCDFCR